MSDLSMFLFARPSFLEGVGRLVDFGGSLSEYNRSPSGERADAMALWADWTAVGNDMRIAWIDQIIEAKKQVERSRDVKKLQATKTTS